MSKIMLIDDDESLRELVGQIAAREGWDYCCSDNGAAGLEMLRRERPDVLVLDVMLPDMNGFDVCRLIRSEGRRVPVVFLSAKGDIVDKSVGFNSGADDYLVKPFLTEELVLRVKVWLNRRARAAAATDARAKGSFCVGDLEVFFKKYEARLRGEAVALSSREFELLALLASEAGTVFTREQII
ncbi:MAG: response regulator transcription factor, partial [Slackia sp.]|nr:response regulator transcription factor [Slackia sp.]